MIKYNMKSYLILITLIFVFAVESFSQQFITVSGKVLDENSKEPLVFASIGVEGKSIGTISNTIGEFDFHIPVEEIDNLLKINMLGYENFEMRISDILDRNISVFYLKKNTQVLDEVTITDSLNGGDILSTALNRIDKNHPMEPFMMDGFYRDLKSVGGSYVALLEAAVKIYDRDYKEPRNKYKLRERVALIEVRKSLGYDHRFTSFFDQTNLLEDLLLHNNIRYRQFSEEESFFNSLKRTDSDFYDGRRVFVLTLDSKAQMKLYIDALTYAFIRMEYKIGKSDNIIDRKKNLESRRNSLTKIIEFKEFAGKMYLSHIDLISDIGWSDSKTGDFKFSAVLHQQLLINKIYPNTREKIGTTEKMKRFGLQYQHKDYNKVFWDNYNLIKETPLDKRIVEDLEKETPLEKQFQDN